MEAGLAINFQRYAVEHFHLLESLASAGIVREEQTGFACMVPGVLNDARIVCAETEDENGLRGISFWLYGEGENWYLGLWSGVFFRIHDPENIVAIVQELLSGTVTQRGTAPGDLPINFRQKYQLAAST